MVGDAEGCAGSDSPAAAPATGVDAAGETLVAVGLKEDDGESGELQPVGNSTESVAIVEKARNLWRGE